MSARLNARIFASAPLIVLVCLIVIGGSAAAAGRGTINAVSYMPIAADAAFEVRVLDNAEQNLELAQRMKEALRLRGRGVREGSSLVMTIEQSDQIGSLTASKRYIMSFTGEASTGYEDDTELRFNIFDSQRGGILNEGENSQAAVQSSEYRLMVRIEDRANGRQLWEGWASAPLRQSSSKQLLNSMISVLAEAVGKTVSQEPFIVE